MTIETQAMEVARDLPVENDLKSLKPELKDAQDAIKTLLYFLGEDPKREGLVDTPARVVKAWMEYCEGYSTDPADFLTTQFHEISNYEGPVTLQKINFVSHCEHHLAPIVGFVDVSYLPDGKVVGISKLSRVVRAFSRRLQTQERFTAEICKCIQDGLKPKGVAVRVTADHSCMSNRGVNDGSSSLVTTSLTGQYETDLILKNNFLTS